MAKDQPPKKRTRRSAKTHSSGLDHPSILPVEEFEDGEVDIKNTQVIKSLIQAALRESIEKQKHVRESEDNSIALISTVSEFLDCFVILGYDQEGDPMIVAHNPTSKDCDALRNLYLKFLPQFMSSQDDLGEPEEI